MKIELAVRGRYFEIPGATARKLAANAWEIAIPRTPAVEKVTRRKLAPEAFDGELFSVDGQECMQAVGSGETEHAVLVTVLL